MCYVRGATLFWDAPRPQVAKSQPSGYRGSSMHWVHQCDTIQSSGSACFFHTSIRQNLSLQMEQDYSYINCNQTIILICKTLRLSLYIIMTLWIIEQKHKSNYNRLHFLIYFLHILRSISTDFSLLQEWWINSIQKCLSTPKHCYQTLCNQLTKVTKITKTRNIKQTLCNQLTKVTKTRNIKQIWYSHKLQSLNC